MEFSITIAASEEISEACGHPEIELVVIPLAVSAVCVCAASSAMTGTWQRREAESPRTISDANIFGFFIMY